MEQRATEAGTELVLDSRKLIVGFVLLIAVCGAFFIIGFMEGKRQAIQARIEPIPSGPATSGTGEVAKGTGTTASAKGTGADPNADRSVREQLDWYKKVQRNDTEPDKTISTAEAAKTVPANQAKKAPAAQPKGASAAPTAPARATLVPARKPSYSVQLGAFRQRHDAEMKAEAVKAKGYECTVEPSKSADPLYLVKVGTYDSRAGAVAMQRKLTKAGFSCFVKTN